MLIRVIDVETSGLDPAVHRVVEIATVDVIVVEGELKHADGRPTWVIERGRMWSSLVNPGIPIQPEASGVHDIVDEMVKDAPMLADIYDGKHLEDGSPDYYCAHNSRFDEKFVALHKPVLDTYRIALWLWPSAPEHKLATLRYWLKLKLAFTELKADEYVALNRNIGRSHRAMWDAYVCAAILRRAFMTGATIEQMVEVSSQPALLPRLTFGKWAMKPIETVDTGYLDWILGQRDMDEDVRHTAFAELQRRRNLDNLKGQK